MRRGLYMTTGSWRDRDYRRDWTSTSTGRTASLSYRRRSSLGRRRTGRNGRGIGSWNWGSSRRGKESSRQDGILYIYIGWDWFPTCPCNKKWAKLCVRMRCCCPCREVRSEAEILPSSCFILFPFPIPSSTTRVPTLPDLSSQPSHLSCSFPSHVYFLSFHGWHWLPFHSSF